MPWVEALLRGQRVLAQAKDDGSFAVEGGRVEVRYKPNDGRAYRASVANLTRAEGGKLLPDDHCSPADAAPKKDASPRRSASSPPAFPSATTAENADRWIAYTDGACSGNPGPTGAGFVIVAPGGKIHEGFDYLGEGTNNIGELFSILRALEVVPSSAAELVIYSDSKYAIGSLTQGWKAKKNPELIAKTKAALEAHRGPVRFQYVPGHSGVLLNERADELAREAIRTRKSQRPML